MARILIVDDSKTSRKMLKAALLKAGHEIVGEADNGEEGFIKYRELKPDLVTMDITMPTMDGIEALQLIRKENEDARVIMVTALGQKEKTLLAIKHGATGFITKPFEEEELIKEVENVLEV